MYMGFGVLAVCWIVSVRSGEAAVVQERKVTSCNTPCSMLQLSCPVQYRLAVRDALFSVTARPTTASSCSVTHSCGTETQCCEQSSVQDCVFSYSPTHLEAVHRNCSGTRACAVKTERTQEESVACPFFRQDETVSHTVMDYVCINENFIVDICSVKESKVEGRTLFTMLDAGRWRNPRGGGVCRCTAESVRWPTTNTIAVFVVDMRLNMLREAHCSKADVTLKSGPATRHLDCESSRDPRQAFPFVALLNHSNVATVELLLHKKLPEIVWIGFESNEVEDIRLTCALQGYMPISDEEIQDVNGSSFRSTDDGEDQTQHVEVAAIAGGAAGALVLCAVLVILLLVFVFHRKRRRQSKADDYSEPHDTVDDMDVYYSIPQPRHSETMPAMPAAVGSGTAAVQSSAGPGDADNGEVYVTAAAVRERKRQSTKKVVRILSIPEISDDVSEYYSSPWDIRDRRRQQDNDNTSNANVHDRSPAPPPLPSPTTCSEEDDDYALLDRHRRETGDEEHERNYDRLSMAAPVAGKSVRKETAAPQGGSKGETNTNTVGGFSARDNRPEPDGCNYNVAFEGGDSTDES